MNWIVFLGNCRVFQFYFVISLMLFPLASAVASTEHRIAPSVSRFDCSKASPGDLITISGGIRSPLTISNCYGSASEPITIRNDPAASSPVVIQRSSGADGGFLFLINNSRHIVVDGSGGWSGMRPGTYCGAPTGREGCGIQIRSADSGDGPTAFFKINGENMRDQVHKGIMVDGSSSYSSLSGARIGIDFNDHSQPPDGPPRENITISHSYVTGVWGEGMYLGPNPSEERVPLGNIEISHNLVENTGRDGVEAKSVYRGVASVIGNVAINVGRRSDSRGQHNGLTVGGHSIFENNWAERSGEVGIRAIARQELPGTGPFTTMIFNNVVLGSGASGPNPGNGIAVTASDGSEFASKIYNNTVVNNLGNGISVSSGAGPSEVWNNIVVGNEGGDLDIRSSGSSVFNNLTGSIGSVKFVNVSANDVRLQHDSPAVDASTGISPARDFLGNRRPSVIAPDQGDFEFISGSAPAPAVAPEIKFE